MLVIFKLFVRSKLTKTLFSGLLDEVSMYMKAVPIGGKPVALDLPFGELVFVVLIKLDILPFLFLSLQTIFQYGKTLDPVFLDLIIVVSVLCILSYLLRL